MTKLYTYIYRFLFLSHSIICLERNNRMDQIDNNHHVEADIGQYISNNLSFQYSLNGKNIHMLSFFFQMKISRL
jgi:hypothetical protein